MVANRLNNRPFNPRAHQVDHLGSGLDTAQRRLSHLVTAGQHIEQHLVQVFQGRGLDAFHGGDAQHDFVSLAFDEKFQYICRLVKIKVHQNGRHNLGVLIAKQFCD